MEKELMRLKATNGTIIAYEDRVVISRKGVFAVASQGFKGDRVFFYNSLSGVDFKKPGMINGYMKFIAPGAKDVKSGVGFMRTSTESASDENTVILRAFTSGVPQKSVELYELILEKINQAHSSHQEIKQSMSQADEIAKYKNLLDNGAITQKEYDQKKQQLLGL